MNHHSGFTELLKEGMNIYGTNYGSSRSGNFQIPVYEEAETEMAAQFQSEATLTLSSGFLAAQLVVRYFEGMGTYYYSPDSHPALLRTRHDYFKGSFQEWTNKLPEKIDTDPSEMIFILCNSLDPLKAAYHDFSWIEKLPTEKSITLIVDDSHGLGITGKNGEGIYSSLRKHSDISVVVVSSMGKAMGLPGGVIIADKALIAGFRSSPYFTSASPMAPAYLYAWLKAADYYAEERTKLKNNIDRFITGLQQTANFRYVKNYPVTYCRNNQLAPFLKEKQILISSFSYPTIEDETITRIILNSHHTEEDIRQLLTAIASYSYHENK
jgi:7-keto-8-aminopelargonate synthetase-like enzyme